MYSVVRHPLYLGNYLMWLGVAAVPREWWLVLLVSGLFWIDYGLIMYAEERFLRHKFGIEHSTWASKTAAIVPRLGAWRRPACPFSLRSVLRREYPGLLAVVACFTVLAVARDFAYSGRLVLDPAWGLAFGLTAFFCFLLRTLKHRTRLLHVAGR
jgi:steroid 5-alpha reductase family enzyme